VPSTDGCSVTPVRASLRVALGRRPLLAGPLALGAIVAMLAFGASPGRADGTSPTVSSVSPASGSVQGGETVTINGSGFVGSQNSCDSGYDIWFGTDQEHGYAISPSSYQVLSDSQIQVTVPANFGGTVNVRVHNACGTSPIQSSDQFSYVYPGGECVSGNCSVSIGSTAMGSLGHVALGFLDGFDTDGGVTITPQDAALVDALHPRQWRLGQSGMNEPGGGVFGLARQAGAQVSLDLTSDWEDWAYTNDQANWQTPYGDLSTYYSFIYNDVKQRIAAGQVPDYFDVWNEPANTGTVDQWLSVYGTAYQAIEAADPGAKVVGPSIASFLVTSAGDGNQAGNELSLTDFLNWEMTSGVRMAAISWHEDGTTVDASDTSPGPGLPSEPLPGGLRDSWSPYAIAAHVSEAKALIASYPALSQTQVFVNEYGPTYSINVPGWMVGDISALEESGANQAMMTCVDGAACSNLLDGLIGSDGTPQMPYWVMSAYSQMSGDMLATSASGSNLYTLATREPGSQTVQALIGRADDCWGGQQCPQFHASSDGPVELSLKAAVPGSASSANVTIEPLLDSATGQIGANDVPTAPAAVTLTDVPVNAGTVTVPVGSANDGDAFFVVITPNVGSVASAGQSILSGASASPGAPASSAISDLIDPHAAKPSRRKSVRHTSKTKKRRARPGTKKRRS
jgi:hypothetical protein